MKAFKVKTKSKPVPKPAPSPTGHTVVVRADPALGVPGQQLAATLPSLCEGTLPMLNALFGYTAPQDWQLILGYSLLSPGRDGSMGADHLVGLSETIYSDVDLRRGPDNLFQLRYFLAEAVEVYATYTLSRFGKVWTCTISSGEALSRLIPNAAYPYTAHDALRSTVVWIDSPDRPDWISQSEGTDRDGVSVGCGAAMLWWFSAVMGKNWLEIVQAGGDTLQDVYARLGGQGSGYSALRAAIDAKWPIGKPSGLLIDNPFA